MDTDPVLEDLMSQLGNFSYLSNIYPAAAQLQYSGGIDIALNFIQTLLRANNFEHCPEFYGPYKKHWPQADCSSLVLAVASW